MLDLELLVNTISFTNEGFVVNFIAALYFFFFFWCSFSFSPVCGFLVQAACILVEQFQKILVLHNMTSVVDFAIFARADTQFVHNYTILLKQTE